MKKSINLLVGLLLLAGTTQLTARDITVINTDQSSIIRVGVMESGNKRSTRGLGSVRTTTKTFPNVMNGKRITVILNKIEMTEDGQRRAGTKEVELGPNESRTIEF